MSARKVRANDRTSELIVRMEWSLTVLVGGVYEVENAEFEVKKGKAPPAPVRRRPLGMIFSGVSIAALGVLGRRRRRGG